MKIQIKSDLHKEAKPEQYQAKTSDKYKPIFNPDADVLVLAGDITNYTNRFSLFHELTQKEDRPIIYLAGNHEYYRSPNATMVVPELQALYEDTNVHFLNRDHVEIDGVLFIGATLWSALDEHCQKVAPTWLNDFQVPKLSVEWYLDQHKRSVEYLQVALEDLPNSKRVVVTHHSPSFRSCGPQYEGDALNSCFHTNLHHLMDQPWSPSVWIHGHTHDQYDYVQGNTRVICNAAGYPLEGSRTTYNDDLIIEI